MSVSHCSKSEGITDIFSIFCNMKVYFVFSLEAAHRGDSDEYTQYTIFNNNNKQEMLHYVTNAPEGPL